SAAWQQVQSKTFVMQGYYLLHNLFFKKSSFLRTQNKQRLNKSSPCFLQFFILQIIQQLLYYLFTLSFLKCSINGKIILSSSISYCSSIKIRWPSNRKASKR